MKSLSLVGALMLAATLSCKAQSGGAEFAAQAPVQLQSNDGLQRIVLPLAVLQQSQRQDLADVRVVDAQGVALPMAWAAMPPAQSSTRLLALPRFAWPAVTATGPAGAPVKVQVNAEGAVVRIETRSTAHAAASATPAQWLLDLSQAPHRQPGSDERPVALQVDWHAPAEGATVQAELEASDDLQTWRHVAQAALLDAPGIGSATSERITVRQLDLPATAAQAKYLRLKLEPAVTVRQVEVELVRTAQVRTLEALDARFEPAPGADGRVREWTLDLRGPVPLRRLQLQLPQRNTVAAFQLERRADTREPWHPVQAFTSYRLVRDGQELASPALDIQAPPARYWRLRLAARSVDIGAEALPATVHWQPPQLVFAARGDGPFALRVGAAKAAAQDVNPSQLIPGYRAGDEFKLPAALLGEVRAIEAPVLSAGERLARSTPAERRRWALWAVLVVAVALLAWLARRLMRDMGDQQPPV